MVLLYIGADCVIVKSKRRLCGTGAALANAPLVQDKSYFEVKIQTGGLCVCILMYHCVYVWMHIMYTCWMWL